MKFKIQKTVDNTGTYYWTIPTNIFADLWYRWNPLSIIIYLDTQNAWDCWFSKEEAVEHIKRWNDGYYKKKYYSKYV